MVGTLALILSLSVAQPTPDDPRVTNCLLATEDVFGPESPQLRTALCIATIHGNDAERALQMCVAEGTEPCPEQVAKPRIWPLVGAGAVGAVVGIVATALAFSL